ncbi:MAG: hypothetical protein EAX86_04760 [Candidatus Heimdallarchaeota archaeon]|nr:hypothetical protein [Candidatus Heimdallarchaeota archaeon]
MSVKGTKLTLNDITVLGLLNEEKRGVTGLQLEEAIERRGMRVWTKIGKSSVYHALKKLQNYKYAVNEIIINRKDAISPPIKEKYYRITEYGRKELEKAVYTVLANHEKMIDPFDIAFAFSGVLTQEKLIEAITQRVSEIETRKKRLEESIKNFSKPNAHGYTLDGTKIFEDLVIQHIIALFTRPLAFVNAEEQWLLYYLEKISRRR